MKKIILSILLLLVLILKASADVFEKDSTAFIRGEIIDITDIEQVTEREEKFNDEGMLVTRQGRMRKPDPY